MKRLVLAISLSFAFGSAAAAAELEFAIAADAGKTNRNSEMTRQGIASEGIFDLILPGDNLYAGSYSSVWGPWTDAGFKFAVTAIGNHNAGYGAEMRFFSMPGEYYTKTFGRSTRFIVLNSDNVNTAAAQGAFLDRELSSATEPFVFVVYHHPTYTLSHFHAWTEKRAFQLAVRPVLTRHRQKITALLLGHDHLTLLAHFGDLPVVISGAVWETRRDSPVNNTQDGVRVTTDWFYDGEAHWAKLTLDDQSRMATVRYLRSRDGSVQCTAHIVTGKKAETDADCR